jgi:hypothetical protein
MNESTLTVIVETARGVLVRTIDSASPLREDVEQGKAAELATQNAAAVWGLPDFVFRPALSRVGSGVREVSDGLLAVGEFGVVIQVKSRPRATDDEAKERRWVEKHVAKGLRQAHGTIRRFRQGPLSMTNGRGREIDLDGRELEWLAVIVVEHPEVPDGVVVELTNEPNPSVVLLRRDWEFLFDQLKSTYAVCHYLKRVAGKSLEVGDEVMRYYDLAQADEVTPPGPVDPRLGDRWQQASAPLMPMRPAGTEEDAEPHLLLRTMVEDIAVSPAPRGENDRLRVLAALDNLPVATRAKVGEYVLDAMNSITPQEGGAEWRLRRVVSPSGATGTVQLGFGVCSAEHDEVVQAVFLAWVQLRHHEVFEVIEEGDSLTTVGVVLTPRTDGTRPWDTTMAAATGDLGLTEDEIDRFREAWPRLD